MTTFAVIILILVLFRTMVYLWNSTVPVIDAMVTMFLLYYLGVIGQ